MLFYRNINGYVFVRILYNMSFLFRFQKGMMINCLVRLLGNKIERKGKNMGEKKRVRMYIQIN